MTGRLGMQEIRDAAYLKGYREGYDAAGRDQVTRAVMDPGSADKVVIERLTAVLAQLREQAGDGTSRRTGG